MDKNKLVRNEGTNLKNMKQTRAASLSNHKRALSSILRKELRNDANRKYLASNAVTAEVKNSNRITAKSQKITKIKTASLFTTCDKYKKSVHFKIHNPGVSKI